MGRNAPKFGLDPTKPFRRQPHPKVMLEAMKLYEVDNPVDLDALVTSARKGSQVAFEALYRATIGPVYGLCLRMTSDPTIAEECAQATYVQAWRKLDGFRGGSAITTWLHRIAVNEVLGQHRRERRHRLVEADPELVETSVNNGLRIDLERAIGTLPERSRQVFVLFGIYGYAHEETAAMLDIAVGTSKAHYHQARRHLQQVLGETP